MDALELMLGRVSQAKLGIPAPNQTEVETLIKMAIRAPDHGSLKPWRFLVIEGDALPRLSELLLRAAAESGESSVGVLDKVKNMPYRAPMILVPIVKVLVDHKVPVIEQQLAGGASAQNILLGLHALGYGGIWRTGELVYNPVVKDGLGLLPNEHLLGFIYAGTPVAPTSAPAQTIAQDFYSYW